MEILTAFVLAAAILALLAIRGGYDSRPGAYSPEEHFSKLGLMWGPARVQENLANQRVAECWTRAGTRFLGQTPRSLLGILRNIGVALNALLVLIKPLTAKAQSEP